MITVLVVASSPRARATLAARLGRHATLRPVTAGGDLDLAAEVEATRPEVLLLEARADAAVSALGAVTVLPRPPAVVLVTDDVRGVLEEGRLPAGVSAVLPRHATAAELAAAVQAGAAGLVALHRDVAGDLAWPGAARRASGPVDEQRLTPREIEVLRMVADGLGNKAIAARLRISDHTVKFHVAAILEKLQASSRTEAVTIGIRRGLIEV